MKFTIYQRGVGRLLSLEADDLEEGHDEAIEAIGLTGLFGEPAIDRATPWLTYVRFTSNDERFEFQVIEEPHKEQPW